MSETFLYILCMASLLISLSSICVSLSLIKSVKIAQQQLQQLFEVLFQLPPGGEYYIQHEDEDENEDIETPSYTSDDSVIDMFSKKPMKYNEALGIWVEVD